MFGRLFGNSSGSSSGKGQRSAPKPTANLNNSIQQLRQAVVTLDKREVHLEKKIQTCINSAKAKSKKRDKRGALHQLKIKKGYEKQLNSIQGKKLNLETQIMALEDAHLNKETLNAMKASANAMKATMNEDEIDKVDDVMEDLNEQMDMIQEMNEAMSQPIGADIDEDELDAELAELEDLEADELLHDLPTTSQRNVANVMPDAPNSAIKPAAQDEEDELAELESMMMTN